MLHDLNYKYLHKPGADTIYLVLHGGSGGIYSPFITNVIETLASKTKESVLGFNFLYCEREDKQSSGLELIEEVATLQTVIEFLRSEGFIKIVIVGKSLGAITASYWLEKYPSSDVVIVVLGYVVGEVKIKAISNHLKLVIQGEQDKFGNASSVEQELAKHDATAKVIEIPGGDHSYRDNGREPGFQSDALERLIQSLS